MHSNAQIKIKQATDQMIFAKATVELIRQTGVSSNVENMLVPLNAMLERALSVLAEAHHA